MGWDCGCGASVGTGNHWCAFLERRHADRVERLLVIIARLLATDRDVIALGMIEQLRATAKMDLDR